jgi:hypothetical protein
MTYIQDPAVRENDYIGFGVNHCSAKSLEIDSSVEGNATVQLLSIILQVVQNRTEDDIPYEVVLNYFGDLKDAAEYDHRPKQRISDPQSPMFQVGSLSRFNYRLVIVGGPEKWPQSFRQLPGCL